MDNKIWAKLYLNLEEYDAKGLVRAFFGALEFDPRNSLVIRGEEAKVEIVFDTTPPSDIIEAISNCDIMELNFGKTLGEYDCETEPAEDEEEEEPQTEAEPAEVEEEEVPQPEAEPEEAEEEEELQPEAEPTEVEEEEEPQTEAEPAEVEEEEVPQPEAEPAEAEEEEEPQPEAESVEVEEEETPQTETEPAEDEEEEVLQPEAESAEVEEEETPQSEREPEEAEEEEVPQPETEPAEAEEPHNEPAPEPKLKKRGGKRVVNPEAVDIPELKEIAGKATSFKHFVKLVAEWMDMRRQREFFEELLLVTAEVDMVAWKELENALKLKKIFFTSSDRIAVSNKVTKKFREYNVTLMPFLATVAEYKNYSFNGEKAKKSAEPAKSNVRPNYLRDYTADEVKNALSEDVTLDVFPKDERKEEHFDEIASPTPVKVKMQCIPEIRSFEETLSSVDKTQPIEERVKYVLTAMGWEKKDNKEKALILAIVKGAITVKEMNFDNIFQKAGIPVSDNFMARMHLAKLINDFVKMHYPSYKMVNVLDFLKELQEIVVLESEIEDFAD